MIHDNRQETKELTIWLFTFTLFNNFDKTQQLKQNNTIKQFPKFSVDKKDIIQAWA